MQKLFLLIWFFLSVLLASAQTNPEETAKIRQQMAKIRQTTDWNNPAAAAKANEEIKRLAAQLSGGKPPITFGEKPKPKVEQESFGVDAASVCSKNIVAIADRFYKRSYPKLDALSKSEFDMDYKEAEKKGFSLESIRELTSKGGAFILFGTDHNMACVYTAAAVRAFPADTLSVNNFGAYLRMIDSSAISIPVLLYANSLFSQSPIILTQIGNSYFELNDFIKAELYYKEAIKADPGFGQAHSALCDLYISQNRLKEALVELFAGVKNMGCSYMQASSNLEYIKQQTENSNGFESKEDFWNETRRQLEPELASLIPEERVRIEIPNFPECKRVEDWLEGGGWPSAVQSYTSFHSYLMKFIGEFNNVHNQTPTLPPNSILRDYPDERLALDCITEMFMESAKDSYDKYSEKVDMIIQTVNDAKELYSQNLLNETQIFVECVESCGGNADCIEDCHRKFCKDECPNANKFNELLRKSFEEWFTEFKKLELEQKKLLEDLYVFTNSWLNKIKSPYWSKIYAYEVRSVALGMAGNCYTAYMQTFQALSHNDCGTDCSVYANPFPSMVDEVDKTPPEGNQCPNGLNAKIPLVICNVRFDCESIEVECKAGLTGKVKHNSRKKTTTGFLGYGAKISAGIVGASARAGVEVTVNDDLSVEDAGARFDISVKAGAGPAESKITTSGTCTVMTGCRAKVSESFTPNFK